MLMLKPELLAPAGDLECALTAFEYGADAVYTGLAQFSARARANSISMDELARLTQYAHKEAKKVYVAVNTLLRDAELPQFLEVASELSRYQVDAVIVQDLGALHLLKNYFPHLTVHASTQMGLHNRAGLRFACDQKIQRVILERQVTWEELQKIIPNSPVETEVFVHGALCISLSGQCLLSSWQEGCSGNRGQCKQPCRRRWNANGDEGYFLSPHDLSIIDYVPKLAQLGVSSFKIEGRLRKPDYIAAVTTAFRQAIDAQGNTTALEKAKQLLNSVMGRETSAGFLTSKSQKTLIRPYDVGAQGKFLGNVVRANAQTTTIQLTDSDLQKGDRIRIQGGHGKQGVATTVTQINYKGKSIHHALQGATIDIPSIAYVPKGAGVYRIGTSLKSLHRMASALEPWHPKVTLNITLHQDKMMICAHLYQGRYDWETPLALAEAQKNPVSVSTLKEAFSVCGDPKKCRFALGEFHAHIEGDYFMPNSVLKQLRQTFWHDLELYEENLPKDDTALVHAALSLQLPERPILGENQQTTLMRTTREVDHHYDADSYIMPLYFAQENEEAYLPSFVPEDHHSHIQKEIKEAINRGVRVFRVTSLAGFDLLEKYRDYHLILHASLPLPVTNIAAAQFLQTLGVSQFTIWHELEKEDKDYLAKYAPIAPEICVSSRPVLMSIRANVPVEGLMNDHAESYEVMTDNHFGITRVIPLRPYTEEASPYAHILEDYSYPDHEDSLPSSFNSQRQWK